MILLLLGMQDVAGELARACERTGKLASYRFSLKITQAGEEKQAFEGEAFGGDAVHLRSERGESARGTGKKLVKRAGEEWTEAGPLAKRLESDDPALPHDWAAKLAALAADAKKEKSAKIGAATVDVWVHSLAHERARESLEAGGLPLWGSVADWSKTSNGVLFYVGRDGLLYRVEQRFNGRTKDGKKLETSIVLEFSEHGKAPCRLPPEIREKIGIR